jgi:hypothetical protein
MKSLWLLALLGVGATNLGYASEFSFGLPLRLTLARNTSESVAIGDANGDGRKDLVLTSALQAQDFDYVVSLFLQRTDGTLSAPIDLRLSDVTFGSYPVAFVDLNHDGADEMVVGKATSGMTVIRLTSTGGLVTVDRAARRGCKFLATGDVDSDGNMDVVCHDWKSTITVFRGDGIGGFASTTEVKSSAGQYDENDVKRLQIADVTGDGRPDLLVTASSINSFFVHPNNGFGGFWPATAYTHPSSSSGVFPAALEVLDTDGDGVNEVVTASPDNRPDAALNIYRRGANGYLALTQRIPLYDSPTALLAGDVDSDGTTDLLAGHYGFNAISLLRGSADGLATQARYDLPGFGNSIVLSRSGSSNSIALGDLDGDGCQDLASATFSGVILLYGCRPFVNRVPVSDFDGDGVGDLLWRIYGINWIELWPWADVDAWPNCHYPCPMSRAENWASEAVGDFDGDGSSEVFWRDLATGANDIQQTVFYSRPITSVTNKDWHVVGAGDFDGDDHSDLLWRNSRTGANTIWKSGSSATTQATSGVTDLRWKVVGVGDFDGDGRSDILWRHSTSGANVIWLGGQWNAPQAMVGVTNPAWQVAGVGDFNGDGNDDVVWRNRSTGANTIWRSAVAATTQAVAGVSNVAWTIAAIADYNGDGRSDLMWHNTTTGANVIWRSADARQQQAVVAHYPSATPIR